MSPTSVLPHKWGRTMLQHANSVTACGCVSFPRQNGGRPGWGAARRGSRLSPTSVLSHKWKRKMLQPANSVAACGSVAFPRQNGGRPGWGAARRGSRLSPTLVLPHKWGRTTLQHANSVMASGSAHLTRLTKLLYKNRTNLCLLTLTVICLNHQQMKVR